MQITRLVVCLFWFWIDKRQLGIIQSFTCVSSDGDRATAPPGRKYFADETTGPVSTFSKAKSTHYLRSCLFWKKLFYFLNG